MLQTHLKTRIKTDKTEVLYLYAQGEQISAPMINLQ